MRCALILLLYTLLLYIWEGARVGKICAALRSLLLSLLALLVQKALYMGGRACRRDMRCALILQQYIYRRKRWVPPRRRPVLTYADVC
jgi:hypothetical protein